MRCPSVSGRDFRCSIPGAAYDVSDRATGLRGRVVVSDGGLPPKCIPVAMATHRSAPGRPEVAPIAWAHGDQHGEFLLVLAAGVDSGAGGAAAGNTLARDHGAWSQARPARRRSAAAWSSRRSVLGSSARGVRSTGIDPTDGSSSRWVGDPRRLRRFGHADRDVHLFPDHQQRRFAVRHHLALARARAQERSNARVFGTWSVRRGSQLSLEDRSRVCRRARPASRGMTRYGPGALSRRPDDDRAATDDELHRVRADVRRSRGAAHADRRRRATAVHVARARACSS